MEDTKYHPSDHFCGPWQAPKTPWERWHLLDEISAGLEVHAKINELPLDALLLVLLLLQLKNVSHKELLQVLICKVDAQLLKTVGRK